MEVSTIPIFNTHNPSPRSAFIIDMLNNPWLSPDAISTLFEIAPEKQLEEIENMHNIIRKVDNALNTLWELKYYRTTNIRGYTKSPLHEVFHAMLENLDCLLKVQQSVGCVYVSTKTYWQLRNILGCFISLDLSLEE